MRNPRPHWINANPEYRHWILMKDRCLNPNSDHFAFYGARGVKVSDLWKDDFRKFLSDMGPRPSPKHTLDRFPDNNGNYEPGNVRWATSRQQANNRRNTIFVLLEGERIPLSDACRLLNLNRQAVGTRIKRGMSPERAITLPFKPYRRTA